MTSRALAFILTVATLLGGCQAARLNPPQDSVVAADVDFVVDETEIVVVTPSQSEARSLIRRAAPLGYSVIKSDNLGELGLTMITLRIPANQDGSSAIRELESLEPGISAGVNHGYVPQGQSRGSSRDYAPRLMNWPAPGCRSRMAIGVLDAKLVGTARRSVTTADFSRNAGSEKSLHGTQVVSLLNSSGLLKRPRIFHADVVAPNRKLGDAASVDTMLRGLNWLMGKNVRLVNVSLAGPYNKILDRAMASAARNGVTVVAPAGNNGSRQSVRYPAAFKSTIAVTAIDADRRIYRRAVRGRQIDISAPGVDIGVRVASRRTYVSGTSFATPLVTASIAADPAFARSARPATARKQLARKARDLGAKGHDPVFGHGLVQAPAGCAP